MFRDPTVDGLPQLNGFSLFFLGTSVVCPGCSITAVFDGCGREDGSAVKGRRVGVAVPMDVGVEERYGGSLMSVWKSSTSTFPSVGVWKPAQES